MGRCSAVELPHRVPDPAPGRGGRVRPPCPRDRGSCRVAQGRPWTTARRAGGRPWTGGRTGSWNARWHRFPSSVARTRSEHRGPGNRRTPAAPLRRSAGRAPVRDVARLPGSVRVWLRWGTGSPRPGRSFVGRVGVEPTTPPTCPCVPRRPTSAGVLWPSELPPHAGGVESNHPTGTVSTGCDSGLLRSRTSSVISLGLLPRVRGPGLESLHPEGVRRPSGSPYATMQVRLTGSDKARGRPLVGVSTTRHRYHPSGDTFVNLPPSGTGCQTVSPDARGAAVRGGAAAPAGWPASAR